MTAGFLGTWVQSSSCHTHELLRKAGKPVALALDVVPMRGGRALPRPGEVWIGPGLSPDGHHRLGTQEVRAWPTDRQEVGRGALISP